MASCALAEREFGGRIKSRQRVGAFRAYVQCSRTQNRDAGVTRCVEIEAACSGPTPWDPPWPLLLRATLSPRGTSVIRAVRNVLGECRKHGRNVRRELGCTVRGGALCDQGTRCYARQSQSASYARLSAIRARDHLCGRVETSMGYSLGNGALDWQAVLILRRGRRVQQPVFSERRILIGYGSGNATCSACGVRVSSH